LGRRCGYRKVVLRRAERRLEEIDLFRLLTAVEKQPRDRAIIEAALRDGRRPRRRARAVAAAAARGGHRRAQRLRDALWEARRAHDPGQPASAWDALQFLADSKEPDERIIAITDERIRQILTAAAQAAGLKKKLSPHWLRHAHGSHAHQRGAPAATIRDTLGHASLSTPIST
jgi:hypothetical protein